MSSVSSNATAPRPISADPAVRAAQRSSASSAQGASASPNTLVGNSIEELDLDVFLDLMLTQLQSQDPLNPMDNQEMLDTISQIREISANDKLSATLDSVLLGQNVATATGLIGAEVEGLTDDGRRVVGAVRQVTLNEGEPLLELAVETVAGAGDREGQVPAGEREYEVVWDTPDGPVSVQVSVDTAALGEDFVGSVRIDNLPETTGPKRVYRAAADGQLRLVGNLPSGRVTTFTDTLSDGQLGTETLTGQRSVVRFADAVTVKLSNVGSVQTLR